MKVTYAIPTTAVKKTEVDFKLPTYLNVEVDNKDPNTGLWQTMKVSSYGQELPLTEEGIETSIRMITDAIRREHEAIEEVKLNLASCASDHIKKKDQQQAVSLHQTMLSLKEKRIADYQVLVESLNAYRVPVTPVQAPAVQSAIKFEQALTHSAVFVQELAGTDMFRVAGVPQPKFFKYLEMLRPGIESKLEDVRKITERLTPEEKYYAAQLMKYRKYTFMTQAQSAIRIGGFKQVVLAANGFNPMAVALAELNPDVQFFCTDMDETTVKTCNLMYQQLGLKNIKYFEHKAGETSLFSELSNYSPTPKAPTYVQAEGLMYYLSEDYEQRFICDVMLNNPANRLLFDFADALELANPDNPLAELHNGVTKKLHAGRGYEYRPEYLDVYPAFLDKHFGDRIVEVISVQTVAHEAHAKDPSIDPEYFDAFNPCGYTVLMV